MRLIDVLEVQENEFDDIPSDPDMCAYADNVLLRYASNRSKLMEERDDFQEVVSFLKPFYRHPTIGEKYSVIGVLVVPPGKLIDISHFDGLATCIRLENNKMHFRIDSTNMTYPDYSEAGDTLLIPLVFDTPTDKDHVLTLLAIRFGHWRLKMRKVA